MQTLAEELKQARQQLDKKLAAYQLAVSQANEAKRTYIRADNELSDTQTAQRIIAEVSQTLQQQAHTRIAAVATQCLQTVFQENSYSLGMVFDKKRGRTEAVIKLERNGLVIDNPLDEVGGGVTDVAGFSLRLAALCLQRPPMRRLLVLDEPFKAVRGKQYRSRVRSLLLTLADELGVQFVICADHVAYPEFLLGKVVEVE